jgi:hypothetical protein
MLGWAQRTISGQVTDVETGEKLFGVTVTLKGSSIGTRTDAEGRYQLEVPADGKTLVFRYTGFETAEIPLGSDNVVNVAMKSSAFVTGELVAVSYTHLTLPTKA